MHCYPSERRIAPAFCSGIEVAGDSPSASAALMPVAWGSDTVEVIVPSYKTQPLKIVVTGWIALT